MSLDDKGCYEVQLLYLDFSKFLDLKSRIFSLNECHAWTCESIIKSFLGGRQHFGEIARQTVKQTLNYRRGVTGYFERSATVKPVVSTLQPSQRTVKYANDTTIDCPIPRCEIRCNCEGWQTNIDKSDAQRYPSSSRFSNNSYTGSIGRYLRWCRLEVKVALGVE